MKDKDMEKIKERLASRTVLKTLKQERSEKATARDQIGSWFLHLSIGYLVDGSQDRPLTFFMCYYTEKRKGIL